MKRFLLLVALLAANVAQAAGPCFWGPGPTSVCGAIVGTSLTINGSSVPVGPASSTDNAVVRFDGTGGATLQDSAVTIGDTGAIADSSTAVSLTISDSANPNTRKLVYDPNNGAQLDIFAANAAGQISGFRQQSRVSAANGVVGRYTAQMNDGTFPCVSGTNCTAIGRVDWQATQTSPVQAGGNYIGSLAETGTATGLFPSMIIHQTARNAFWGFAAGSQSATAGLDNTGIGDKALRSLQSTGSGTGGNRNSGFGARTFYTGSSNTLTGNDNTAGGYSACDTLQSGSNNLCLGSNSDVGSSSFSNASAIGANASVGASNKMVFGDTAVTGFVFGTHRSTSGTAPTRSVAFGNSAGTDLAGGAGVFVDSAGTGTAHGGGFYFNVGIGGAGSSSTVNTQSTAFSIEPGTAAQGSTVFATGQATQSVDIFAVENSAFAKKFAITAAGAVGVSGSVGSTGQVLTSSGAAAPPTWTTLSVGASGATGSVQFASGGALASDNSNFFWDDTNNRLGIGNAAPSVPLHVTGTTYLDGPAGATALRISDLTNAVMRFYFPSAGVAAITQNEGHNLVFGRMDSDAGANYTEYVRIRNEAGFYGYVGIGTAAPDAKLHVVGVTHLVGNVGINVASPGDALEVIGNGRFSGNIYISDPGGTGGNMLHEYERSEGSDSGTTTCTDTCAAGQKVIGGGCHSTSGVALQDSYPSSDTVWTCDYLATTTNCKATAICVAY